MRSRAASFAVWATAVVVIGAACTASSALGARASGASPAGVLLRYRFRAGQVLTYRVTIDVRAGMPGAGAGPGGASTARTGTNRMRVLGVAPNGTASIRAVQTTALRGGGSAAPTTLTYSVSPTGRVTDVKSVAGREPELLGAALNADAIALMQAPLPSGRVKVGETWTASIPSPFQGQKPVSVRTKVVRVANGRAELRQAYTIAVDLSLVQRGQPVKVAGKVSMRGTTVIDVGAGLLRSSSTTGSGPLLVSIPAGPDEPAVPARLTLTLRTSMQRTK